MKRLPPTDAIACDDEQVARPVDCVRVGGAAISTATVPGMKGRYVS